jgi:hypothetical protein
MDKEEDDPSGLEEDRRRRERFTRATGNIDF